MLSVTVDGMPGEQAAARLSEAGVAVRAGLQCAPMAHRHFGTLPDGTVRLAPSAFSTQRELETICKLFYQITQKSLHAQENMV